MIDGWLDNYYKLPDLYRTMSEHRLIMKAALERGTSRR